VQTSTDQSTFTLSWLEREEGFLTYLVRQSDNLRSWRAAEVVVVDPLQTPPPAGYVRKQATVPAVGNNFYRVLATIDPDTVPDESFTIMVAGAPVTVERWGTGPKGIVFFGYAPFDMEENLKQQYGHEFAALVGEEYSIFLWTYPESAAPYSQVGDSLDLFFQNQAAALANRLDLAGQASAVVNQIRATTGLTDICVVGNSFGAGVILWDFATLANDPNLRCVLISPSELFMPFDEDLPPANPLPGTVLVADAPSDVFFLPGPVWVYVRDRTNGPLPAGYTPGFDNPHLIIGEDPTSLDYVFSLIDLAFQTP
jgi:hypothetical protein